MAVLCAADEADTAKAEAPRVDDGVCGLDQPRVIGQPEVVVGAEVQNFFLVGTLSDLHKLDIWVALCVCVCVSTPLLSSSNNITTSH